MVRRLAFAAAAVALLGAAGCAPITSHHGFQAIEASPKDVKVGVDTKSTVRGKLGSPSATSTFDGDTWFYVNSVKARVAFRRPQTVSREVTAIVFAKDSEMVEDIRNYTLKDGKAIAYNGRETPTRGREMTVLEQLLGTVGRGSMLPTDGEGLPGNRPGERPR
jgi:outer membrane protein assembly factor BamE (lipoprotein component of BamABCDE complex)